LAKGTPPQTPDTRTLRAPTQQQRTTATFVRPAEGGQGTRTSAPESHQLKVGAETHVHTISEDDKQLKIQLAQSQRDNIDIQAELKTTQDRAASSDIQLKRKTI